MTKDNETQDDGLTEEDFVKDDVRAQIYANREKIVDQELERAEAKKAEEEEELTEDSVEDSDETPEETSEETSEETPEEEMLAPSGEVPEQPPTQDAPDLSPPRKVKIKGIEYTPEELEQLLDKRQPDMSELQKQFQAMLQSQQTAEPKSQEPPVDSRKQDEDARTEKLRDISRRLEYGNEEERVQALQDAGALYSEMPGKEFPDPEQLVAKATQQAIAVMQAQQERDILQREFADILEERSLRAAADERAIELAEKYWKLGVKKSRLELLREAGQDIRDKYLKPPSQNTESAPNVVQMTDRIERKRTAPKPPTAANKVASLPEKEKLPTAHDVVNQMRVARGQHKL